MAAFEPAEPSFSTTTTTDRHCQLLFYDEKKDIHSSEMVGDPLMCQAEPFPVTLIQSELGVIAHMIGIPLL